VSLKLSVVGIIIERSNNGTNTLKRAIVLKREVLFLAIGSLSLCGYRHGHGVA